MRARHRLSGQLLRHGVVYYGGKPWTMRHDTWLRAQQLGHRDARAGFEAYYDAVVSVTARRARLDALITERAAEEDYRDLVRRLCCLRGVGTLTGFALAVEIGDWGRFTGSSIGSFVGLVPSEDSSGETTRRGAITKAGNTHARRLLVEAAWHHRRRYLASRALQHRWQASTPAAAARADKGNRRLHRRWAAFDARAKKPTIANTAIARELAAWCWSLAVMD
jgi:transposase